MLNEKDNAIIEFITNKSINKKDISMSFNSSKIFEGLKYRYESKNENCVHQMLITECSLEDSGDYQIKIKDVEVFNKLVVKG